MKKYLRWIIFGIIAFILLLLMVLVGANKKLRQQINVLLQEQLIKTKIRNLQDKAIVIKHKADNYELDAEEAEASADEIESEIQEQKRKLEYNMMTSGLSADEISNRFNNLNI